MSVPLAMRIEGDALKIPTTLIIQFCVHFILCFLNFSDIALETKQVDTQRSDIPPTDSSWTRACRAATQRMGCTDEQLYAVTVGREA